ncbi:MAG TPA: NAD+ synthase [Chloroflexota bacterium]
MRTLRVALAQINTTVGGLDENADRIIEWIRRAEDVGAEVVAFPELAITGYPPEDLVLKPEFIRDNLRTLDRVAAAVGDLTAIVGFVDTDGSETYNAAAIIQQGTVVGIHHKFYLPNYSVFDEQRYFKAGSEWGVYTVHGVKLGITICEDIWYPIGPGTLQSLAGAEVIININASPYRALKYDQRYRMVSTRAMDELTAVCYLNVVGGQDELVFEGASMIFDQDGNLLQRGAFFEEDLLVADLDIDAVFSARLHDARRRQSIVSAEVIVDAPGRVIDTPLAAPVQRPHLDPLPEHCCPVPERLEEIYGALVLGTRDYIRKCGFSHVILGLSGGIDSSLTACIAVDAVGADHVTGVSNPSRYSSEGSRSDAAQLAEHLGIRLLSIPIEAAFSAYLETMAEAFTGTEVDITEENMQARIRGNIWMALSNKFGGIVLTAGNKSELAVGYSTLYGDMAGGFAVLKDVYKTTVYELAAYKNQRAGREIIPHTVLEKAPSAELRPEQRDQDSLPPYEVLDGILRLYVDEDRSASDIVGQGYDAETVTRVISLVDHNEYKRRQAPPGVKISVRAFGKDRRLPIANHYRDLPDVEHDAELELVARQAEAEAQVKGGVGRAAR